MEGSAKEQTTAKLEDEEMHKTGCGTGTCVVFMSSAVASVGGFLFGYDIGIVSGAMLQLREVFRISCVMQEFIVSSLLIGAFLASLVGGSVVDGFGRKFGMLLSGILFIGGAILLACSNSVPLLLVGRFVVGFGVSLSLTADCAYISEISPANYRGMMVTLNELGITIGFLIAYVVNYVFITVHDGWRYMFGLSSVPAAFLLAVLAFLPQSPYYLVSKGRNQEAKKVLIRIRPSCNADAAVQEIVAAVKEEKSTNLRSLFGKTDNMRWRMVIAMLLVLFQQFSGNANILYYAPTIFSQIGFCSKKASTFASVGLGLIKVLAAFFSMFLLDRFGRRRFLLIGCVAMVVSLMTLGAEILSTSHTIHGTCSDSDDNNSTAFYSNGTAPDDDCPVSMDNPAQKTISVVFLMAFVFFYGISFGVGSWLVLSEIFPTTVRGRCISIATAVNWLGNIIVSMTFLELFTSLGVGQTFIVYAVICLAAFLFIFFCLPETKGKTLEQISSELNNRTQFEMPQCCKYVLCRRRGQHSITPSELVPISKTQLPTVSNGTL